MKRVLIVSPHFVPINAADMHRVRQSLPYFEANGWKPVVLCVYPEYIEMAKDDLLRKSIPQDIEIHQVAAFSSRYTRKLGLGNLGIRAFLQLYIKGNELLKNNKFDLIYFSTTVFACMPLGRIWKKRFKVPFVIDMQDPWRNDYYLSVPKSERPAKFWFSYRLDKYLEAYTMPKVDGIISVSPAYVEMLKSRYEKLKNIPYKILTFGTSSIDFQVANDVLSKDINYQLEDNKINIIYAGAIPKNMLFAIESIFVAINKGLLVQPKSFENLRLHFIGSNYTTGSLIKSTLGSLIEQYGLSHMVFEHEERLPYFDVLKLIQQSSLAIIPGTLDADYTASKLYPYVLTKIPILAIFHEQSTTTTILKELNAARVVSFNNSTILSDLSELVFIGLLDSLKNLNEKPNTNWELFKQYSAEYLTIEQVKLFDEILT